MIFPSQIRRPQNRVPQLDEVETGLYVIRDAYDGVYEYFPGRPIRPEEPIAPSREDTGRSLSIPVR